MNKIKIREDLHNQYINHISSMTFKQLEENYNHLVELLNAVSKNEDSYVICSVNKETGKYSTYCVNNKIYDLREVIKECAYLNRDNNNPDIEFTYESVVNSGVIELVKFAHNILKE